MHGAEACGIRKISRETMRIKRTFFLAALIEVVIISGCACPKRNIQQHEKPIQVEIATNESQKAKPNPIEEKGNLFRVSQ